MTIPVKFKCPSGHLLSFDHFHSTVKLDEPDIMKAVVFTCDGGKRGHEFTLEKAVAKGMFTKEQGDKIASQGKEHRRMYSTATTKGK